ncbi:hypothetical protein LEP1GSC060_0939 [Leptospira weilii serovar Ranarum str. ICFT]|uniref:Lipoprotein n=1 Tax=Leptospira weilii serovar Ranarum str. ICFT TaxID=1218598 RepID=N1WFQ8_9LEPT|nr:hypothetical protein LEP1GSC060_0939 [Leptospira weilii serovar Ranarum str. ICFT]
MYIIKTLYSIRFFILLFPICILANCGIGFYQKNAINMPIRSTSSDYRGSSTTEMEFLRINIIDGQVETLYGMNVGIANTVKDGMVGLQAGLYNEVSGTAAGIQVGIVNSNTNGIFGIQIGGINSGRSFTRGSKSGNLGIGISAGAVNFATFGVNVALFNFGVGLNVGVANYGAGASIGIVNYGSGFKLGILNVDEERRDGFLNIGVINLGRQGSGIQIGIINYCPNDTIPIMILANYCSKSSPEKVKSKTPPNTDSAAESEK